MLTIYHSNQPPFSSRFARSSRTSGVSSHFGRRLARASTVDLRVRSDERRRRRASANRPSQPTVHRSTNPPTSGRLPPRSLQTRRAGDRVGHGYSAPTAAQATSSQMSLADVSDERSRTTDHRVLERPYNTSERPRRVALRPSGPRARAPSSGTALRRRSGGREDHSELSAEQQACGCSTRGIHPGPTSPILQNYFIRDGNGSLRRRPSWAHNRAFVMQA